MELNLKSINNLELINKKVSEIEGLKYYYNFLTEVEQNNLYKILGDLNFKIVNGKPTIYFGVNYTHRKKIHDKDIKEIPYFLNLLKPLKLEYDQLEIQYYRKNDGHGLIKESNIFQNNTIIIPIGSHFIYDFNNEDKWISFLMQPGSLLLNGSKMWTRRINRRRKERFNNYIFHRKPFYLLTFRNMKK